jgi:hypothetical protein
VAHAKSNSSFGVECRFCIQHATSYEGNGAWAFILTMIFRCRFGGEGSFIVSAFLARLQVRYRSATELIVIAEATLDGKEDGAIEEHVHDNTVTGRAEQSMQSAPYWSF